MRLGKISNRLWFLALCLFWGGTWLAVKVTVTDAPPLLVACTRAILSGCAMFILAGFAAVRQLMQGAPWRVSLVAFLTTTFSFAAVFWGTARLSTGLAAIVNNAAMPIGLLVFGYLLREQTVSRRQVFGIALGVIGLGLLFARRTQDQVDSSSILGLVCVLGGALSYCLGSVLARPLLRVAPPFAVGSMQLLLGGIAMVPAVWILEQPTAQEFELLLSPKVMLGMAWMVIAGGVAATYVYLRLIRDWGPTRAGMYAFVTPIIATVLGAIVLGERLGTLEIVGSVTLLCAAALVLPRGEGKRMADRPARGRDSVTGTGTER